MSSYLTQTNQFTTLPSITFYEIEQNQHKTLIPCPGLSTTIRNIIKKNLHMSITTTTKSDISYNITNQEFISFSKESKDITNPPYLQKFIIQYKKCDLKKKDILLNISVKVLDSEFNYKFILHAFGKNKDEINCAKNGYSYPYNVKARFINNNNNNNNAVTNVNNIYINNSITVQGIPFDQIEDFYSALQKLSATPKPIQAQQTSANMLALQTAPDMAALQIAANALASLKTTAITDNNPTESERVEETDENELYASTEDEEDLCPTSDEDDMVIE